MRSALVALAAACFLALAPVALPADPDDGGPDGGAGVRPPEHDVACFLTLRRGADLEAGAPVEATLFVRNRAKNSESDVTLAVYADDVSGTPLWTGTASLRGRRRLARDVRVDVPAGATSLVGYATVAGDENAGNDADAVPVGASRGAPTYAKIKPFLGSTCAACHHGAAAPDGVRLATYVSAAENASAALAAMRDGLMPRRGAASPAAIDRFEAWLRGGRQR